MSDDSTQTISRRQFTSTAAMAALSAAIVPSRVLGQEAPSNKLNLAAIGIGGMGAPNLKACAGENIVALCDVDDAYAAKTIALYPKAKVYHDYREMLEKEKGIDAVVIARPTTRTPRRSRWPAGRQARLLREAADAHRPRGADDAEPRRAYKVVTQMGNQGHSTEYRRLLKEVARRRGDRQRDRGPRLDGPAGGGDPWRLRRRPAGRDAAGARRRSTGTCGSGRWRSGRTIPAYHPLKWRAGRTSGPARSATWAATSSTRRFWALELGPSTVEATSTHFEPAVASETYPRACIVRYTFPARGSRPPVKLTWTDGRLLPPRPPEMEPGASSPGSGALLIGDKGTILHGSHGADGVRLIPETRMQGYTRPPQTLRRVVGSHEGDWIRAIKEGRTAFRPARRSIRRRAHRDGAARRAGHPHEGSAARVGQQEPAVHQQRRGRTRC